MTINRFRNEVEFPYRGAAYVVRPTFQVLATIETTTGAPVSTLLRRFSQAEFSARDVGFIIHAVLRDQVKGIDLAQVSEALEEDGITSFLNPIINLLTRAMHGSKKMRELDDAARAAEGATEGADEGESPKSATGGDGPSRNGRGKSARGKNI